MEGFKPFGIPITELEPVILLFEEYESIRLTDYEGLTQLEAAIKMNISRPTFTRVYEKARRTIARAFVEGKAIFIEGGNYHTDDYWYRCEACLKVNISKEEIKECTFCNTSILRKLNKPAESFEANGNCICVTCNTTYPHKKGIPCRENNCPNCGKTMMREGSYHHQLYLKTNENENSDSNKRATD
jgi:predicted DNA-binding protein (UPF0251 family)